MALHFEHAQAHIAAAHDQNALAAKAAGQGTEWGLIGGQNRGLRNIQLHKDTQR
jgi:hypothetical protein